MLQSLIHLYIMFQLANLVHYSRLCVVLHCDAMKLGWLFNFEQIWSEGSLMSSPVQIMDKNNGIIRVAESSEPMSVIVTK